MNKMMIQELTLRQAMQRQIDAIVRSANADAALLEGSKIEKNQIRNVLNVAEESHSLAVVANFIRYQLGRSQTGPAWRHNGFGLRVIEQIESPDRLIARQAEAVLGRLRERFGEVPSEVAENVRYELMRYYLGYLHRAFYYGKETGNWDDLRRAGKEAQHV